MMEIIEMFFSGWMDDNNVVIYILGYYFLKINGIMKFIGKWVGIEKRLMNDII